MTHEESEKKHLYVKPSLQQQADFMVTTGVSIQILGFPEDDTLIEGE